MFVLCCTCNEGISSLFHSLTSQAHIALLYYYSHSTPRTTHHAQRTTHHAPRTTQHAARSTQHAARSTHHILLLTFHISDYKYVEVKISILKQKRTKTMAQDTMKLVAVGNGGVGKTCLLITYALRGYPGKR